MASSFAMFPREFQASLHNENVHCNMSVRILLSNLRELQHQLNFNE